MRTAINTTVTEKMLIARTKELQGGIIYGEMLCINQGAHKGFLSFHRRKIKISESRTVKKKNILVFTSFHSVVVSLENNTYIFTITLKI